MKLTGITPLYIETLVGLGWTEKERKMMLPGRLFQYVETLVGLGWTEEERNIILSV